MNKSLRKSVGQNLKKKWWYKWSLGGKKREKGAKKFEKKKNERPKLSKFDERHKHTNVRKQ